MCGIVGFLDKRMKEEKSAVLEKMMERIYHRGPSSDGKYIDEKAAIGFRRLSIIDLAEGHQPLYNEDKKLVLTFNGEIYNHNELRDELKANGHIFETGTDSEVIIHGYEQWGKEVVNKLRGMFAFVIWDTEKKELFGARDIFGIKPFYYMNNDETFLYGSEIKAFLEHPDFVKEVNKDALKPYLTFQYSALDETFFKGVYKLKPAHCFTIKDGQMEIEEYYKFEIKPDRNATFEELVDETKKVVEETVAFHACADVPIGAFLSGGIDSSYITGTLKPEQTFSVGFENEGFSEVAHAEELSKILGAENVNKTITPEEFFGILETMQYHSDEPHANLSAVPLYFLSELARKHVTVVLSGEGADELFGGYDTYKVGSYEKKYRKLPKGLRYAAGKVATKLPKFRGRDFLERNGLPVEEWYIGQAHIFDEKDAKKIVKAPYKNGPTPQEITKPYFDKVKDYDEMSKKQYLDLHLWQPNDILLKADKMTMAHCIEARVPFLENKVMDLAAKIPTEYKLHGSLTKYVLRQAAYEVLPEEWAKRPKKGFPVPFAKWTLEEKWYKEVRKVLEEPFVEEFFDQKAVLKLIDDHYAQKVNNGRKVYTIYAFLVWYKAFFINETEVK